VVGKRSYTLYTGIPGIGSGVSWRDWSMGRIGPGSEYFNGHKPYFDSQGWHSFSCLGNGSVGQQEVFIW